MAKSKKTRATAAAPADAGEVARAGGVPQAYAHSRRPQWGRAFIEAHLDDRIRYVFEDGNQRTFLSDNPTVVEVEVPEEEREALAKRLLRTRRSAASGSKA